MNKEIKAIETEDEIKEAVEICTGCFINDPIYLYTYEGNEALLKHLFTGYFHQTHQFKQQYYIAEETKDENNKTNTRMASVMMMIPPNTEWPEDLWNTFRIEHSNLISTIGNDEIQEKFDVLEEEFFDVIRHDLKAHECAYLPLIATHPEYRKKGYASKLLQYAFDKADKLDGHDIYLECEDMVNIQ